MAETWDEVLEAVKDVRRRVDELEFQMHLIVSRYTTQDSCEVCGRRWGEIMRAGPGDCVRQDCPLRPSSSVG